MSIMTYSGSNRSKEKTNTLFVLKTEEGPTYILVTDELVPELMNLIKNNDKMPFFGQNDLSSVMSNLPNQTSIKLNGNEIIYIKMNSYPLYFTNRSVCIRDMEVLRSVFAAANN